MPFQVDQRVRIKGSAFLGSDDPEDVALRGQIVTLTFDLSKVFDPKEWAGCWEAITDMGQPVQLTEDEIEIVEVD